MNDALDNIMLVMEAAFDPVFGEAWTRRQVGDALIIPHTHAFLAGPDGQAPAESAAATGFAMSRQVGDEEELLLIAVRPEWRGRGIGAALLTRFIEKATAHGARRLLLEMREGNPAEKLYRAHGFEEIGRRRGYYNSGHGFRIDAITFARIADNRN